VVVLTCISLMTSGYEHLFMYPVAICMSSLQRCLFISSVHFLNNILCVYAVELYDFFIYFSY